MLMFLAQVLDVIYDSVMKFFGNQNRRFMPFVKNIFYPNSESGKVYTQCLEF